MSNKPLIYIRDTDLGSGIELCVQDETGFHSWEIDPLKGLNIMVEIGQRVHRHYQRKDSETGG